MNPRYVERPDCALCGGKYIAHQPTSDGLVCDPNTADIYTCPPLARPPEPDKP